MPTPDASLPRRRFLQSLAAAGAVNLLPSAMPAAEPTPAITPRKIKLGFDNFSIRGFRWKAPRQIEYAATLKIDVLFISDLDSYESLEDGYLRDQAKKAHDLGLEIYAGGWSICPTSKSFRNKWGTAEEHLALGIRVAKAVGQRVRMQVAAADGPAARGEAFRQAHTHEEGRAPGGSGAPPCSARTLVSPEHGSGRTRPGRAPAGRTGSGSRPTG